ncbi:hypothetical protein HH308_08055 [Gordonia sp. TBRC 11910]|uniref:Osmoprotectant transport system substrate-binding protein n=1 Tax=Gordonia asplenii TaxID=2725283 RepID=A0A848KRX1_9ACTN|nr:hypothetical protein [Gordonia asplenii]
MNWPIVLVAAFVGAVGLAGCSVPTTPDTASRTLVVGAPADPALQMAARIYRAVLVATGWSVAPDVVVGDDAGQLTAMSAVRRDLFPAFSGRLLASLVPANSRIVDAAAGSGADFDPTYVALNKALPQGVSLADPTTVTLAGLSGAASGGPASTQPSGPSQQLVPVYRSAALRRDQLKTINKVAGELTADDLVTLVAQARTGDPAAIAARWVLTHGLNR